MQNLTDAVSKAMKNVKATQHDKYKDFKKKVDKLLKKGMYLLEHDCLYQQLANFCLIIFKFYL